MNNDRVILHCDCNSFFASVECTLNPKLWHVPMAVVGDPKSRHGIVLAKNELAKKYDIKTAETVWQAKKKCPDLVCVPTHREKYYEFYEHINQIYLDYTDLVEPFSIDESYLDITGTIHLFNKTPKELADEIRHRVKTELGITISVGVSFCKVLAKLGSDYKKPDATTVIMREDIPEIVYPLPVGDLLFVGKKSVEALNKRSIRTIGELSELPKEYLVSLLGKHGELLYNQVHGLDDEPVKSFYDRHEAKSVGNGMTFRRDLVGEREIRAGVGLLSDSVATRLRSIHKKCTVIQVAIKDPNFKTIQRQCKLTHATMLQKEITETAMNLILSNWDLRNPIRLITVTACDLIPEGEEIPQQTVMQGFFEGEDERAEPSNINAEKQQKIEDTIADIRKKFGTESINFGYSENEDLGIHKYRGFHEKG